MSYGHYWGRPRTISDTAFSSIVADVRAVIARVAPTFGLFGGIKVRGATGRGRPLLDADHICFNGNPGRETFWIAKDFHAKYPERTPGDDGFYWDFVKTSELPYDAVVVAALTALKVHVPEARLSSDGGEEEWAPGIALYRDATGRDVPFESLTA